MSEVTGGHDTLPELQSWVKEDGGEAASAERAAASQEVVREQTWSEEDWQLWNHWQWGWRGQGQSWSFSTSRGSQEAAPAGTLSAGAAQPVDSEVRDPWLDHDPWQKQGWSWSQSKGKDGWWGSSSKGDYADPPTWAGWGHYRLWRRSLVRWNSNIDVAQYRRAEKILKGLEWELQAKLEHIDEDVLASPGYLDAIFGVLDVLAGEREDSDKRRSIRAALYEGHRKSEESLAQYALRRESQFASASKYMAIPDELKAFMLEEQSGLTKQGSQNLTVLTEGRHEYAHVRKALQVLDVEEESLFKSGKSSYLVSPEEERVSDSESDSELVDEEVYAVLKEKDLDEDEALSFLAQHVPRRRTWSENRQLKAARKKDRRHFDDRDSRPERPKNHRRLPVAEPKKITRCSNCGAKGHWREDCDKPYRSKESRERAEKSLPGASAFVFLGTGAGEKFGGSFLSCPSFSEDGNLTFLSLPPGHAIVDPGASQDLIGKKSYDRLVEALASCGLKPIELSEKPAPASGVGGDAKPLFNALVPCILGGKPGIVKMTIVQEDIPQLLSVGLLEHAGAIIDVARNQLEFKSLGSSATMNRLSSGHRTIDVASWKGGTFPVPKQLELEFCLRPGAFERSDFSARRAYMQLSEDRNGSRVFVHESFLRFVLKEHPSVVTQNQHVFTSSPLCSFPSISLVKRMLQGLTGLGRVG